MCWPLTDVRPLCLARRKSRGAEQTLSGKSMTKLTWVNSPAGALASVMVHGPAVCEHCIATAQLQASRRPKREPLSQPELAALFQAVQEWEAWLQARETSAPEGFIAARRTGWGRSISS